MKVKCLIAIIAICSYWSAVKGQVIVSDPALTAAVAADMASDKVNFGARVKSHLALIAEETALNATMHKLHKLEEKAVDYLSNASMAVENLYQVKRIGELVAIEIPKNFKELIRNAKGNLQGSVVTILVSDYVKDARLQMLALAPMVANLVTSGTFNFGKGEKKVNLLNAQERYYILSDILRRLESINTDAKIMRWQVQMLSWKTIVFKYSPLTWGRFINGKYIAKKVLMQLKNF